VLYIRSDSHHTGSPWVLWPTFRAISALGVSGTELGEWADVASE